MPSPRQCLMLAAILGVMVLASSAQAQSETGEALRIFVSVPPHADLAARIGGDLVTVDVLVKPGESPATYSPTPRQIAALSRADVYFRTGVPFEEGLLPRIERLMATLQIVDLRTGIALRDLELHDHGHPQDGGAGREEELHEGKDPHIWLSPDRLAVQAATICETLAAALPAHKTEFEENRNRFLEQLEKTKSRLADLLAPCSGQTVFVYHPAYGYFLESYGIKQRAVEIRGKGPSPRQLAELMELAKAGNARVIFVQPQFDQKSAKILAQQVGAQLVVIDPLARDVLHNLEHMAASIHDGLAGTR